MVFEVAISTPVVVSLLALEYSETVQSEKTRCLLSTIYSVEDDVVFTGAWSSFFAAAEAKAAPDADLVAKFVYHHVATWHWSISALDGKTFGNSEGNILSAYLPVYRMSNE